MRFDTVNLAVRDVGRTRWLAGAGIAALWVAGVGYYALLADTVAIAVCGVPLLLMGGTAALLAWMRGTSIAGKALAGAPGSVTLSGDRIAVIAAEKRRELTRAEIESAWVERWPDAEEVVLLTRTGLVVRFWVPPHLKGNDVLTAAGLSAEQRTRVMRTSPPDQGVDRVLRLFGAITLTPVLLGLALVTWALASEAIGGNASLRGPAAGVAVAFVGAVFLLRHLIAPFLPTTVHIGLDGVRIDRLFRKKLLRRGDLTEGNVRGNVVFLWRRDGRHVEIACAGPAEAEAIADQIRAILAPGNEGDARSVLVARLDRAGRSADDWWKELRALVDVKEAYRAASFAPEELLAVARDASVTRVRRIAAAAALSAHKDGELRSGLRLAAEASVDPKLRAAFERAADGELEAAELDALAREEAAG